MNSLNSKVVIVALFFLVQLAGVSSLVWAQGDSDWQKKWDAAIAAAKQEAKVVVMGPPGDAVRQALIQGFTKAFPGISIEFSGGRGGEVSTKIKAERDAGIYSVDIVINGTSTANSYFKPMKALDPIEPQLILPEVVDPKQWRDDRLEFSDRSTRFDLLLATQNNVPVIFNAKQAKAEEVDELSDLLNPKWKGKIAVQDPIPSGSGNGVFRWLWGVLGAEKTMAFYQQMKTQAAVVDRDQRRQIEWVAQGRYPINFAPGTVIYQLAKRGLKFEVVPALKDLGSYLSPGFGSAMYINRAPHPNAAKVFLNWLLSKEGQTAFVRAMGYVSRRKDVSAEHVPSYWVPQEGVKYYPNYYEEVAVTTPEQAKFLKSVFGR